MNANPEIEQLLKNHNYPVEKNNEGLLAYFNEKVLIKSNLVQSVLENGCTSRLDVSIELPNGLAILESFGDFGGNEEEAKLANLNNFALNAFHVITACLNDKKEDDQITFEEWTFSGVEWEVYIGDFGLKNMSGEPISMPVNLFETIEIAIKKNNFQQDYCWVRFFFAQYHNQISAIELLINNELNQEGVNDLSLLPWELTDEFYSIRNFLMMKKKV